jgi:pimeloyl-ACP methyl ester carboxylesterase
MRTTVNGIDLHYEISGAGQPVLWLHGFFGIGADWRHIFGEPPSGLQMIAPDLRGHGATVDAGGGFSFRDCARDVLALLDHLQIDRVRAIGLSGGGIVLLHLATLAPARVESMIAISAPPYFPEQARVIQRAASEAQLGDAERASMRERHSGGDAQIAALFAQARAFADDRADVQFDAARLATIAAETLIVFGDRDPLYPVALAVELFSAIPRAYLWVVPNGGHAPVFGPQARAFARVAAAFLATTRENERDWSVCS